MYELYSAAAGRHRIYKRLMQMEVTKAVRFALPLPLKPCPRALASSREHELLISVVRSILVGQATQNICLPPVLLKSCGAVEDDAVARLAVRLHHGGLHGLSSLGGLGLTGALLSHFARFKMIEEALL